MSILSLNSYIDLFNKCRQEFDQLNNCSSHPEYDFILFNIIMGMNHIYEWFLKEKIIEESRKLKCVREFNPFTSPYDVSGDFKQLYRKLSNFPKTNKNQEVIRKLCNKAKHFKKTEIETQGKNLTAVAGAAHMQCGEPNAVAGAFDHYTYSVDINGENVNLEILIKSHIENWGNFLAHDCSEGT